MLTYKFIDIVNGEFVYAYYPDGKKGAPGKVAISGNGQGRVVEESTEDFGKRYAYHAIKGIDVTKKSGTVAWY